MILLPKGTPLKEKIDPGRIHLPEAFGKLRTGGFTGYLRFETPHGTGIVIFEQGRLISALLETANGRSTAREALLGLFERALQGGATLDIFRISPELAMGIHALLHGSILYQGQEVKLIDVRSLLARMKNDRISGCLRIYTEERIALIFYREGNPLGFFHDGCTDLETTADNSMSVARLPGAKIDVLTAREDPDLVDLADQADLAALWKTAQAQVEQERRSRQAEDLRSREVLARDRRQKVLLLLQSVAESHLGRIGHSLVEKEFEKISAASAVTEASLAPFYDRLANAAKLVAGPSAISRMREEMKKRVNNLLQTA